MIVTRTPLRISLGGGGTDLPNFAAHYGGELVSAAIDVHVYVVIRQGRLDGRLRYSYETTGLADRADALDDALVRACLKHRGVEAECEIGSFGGVPAGSGLGSSGAFTVGLLHAFDALLGREPDPLILAEDAWRIEHDHLGRPVGKHDPYITGLGGLRALHIRRDGAVNTERLALDPETVTGLQDRLLLFYTGRRRDSRRLLSRQDVDPAPDAAKAHYLHEVKRIGARITEALRAGDLPEFGRLLHLHWLAKSRSAAGVTNPRFAEIYRAALENGALGGKLLGAGGGGFFLFYVPRPRRDVVMSTMARFRLRHLPFHFTEEGTTVLLQEPESEIRPLHLAKRD